MKDKFLLTYDQYSRLSPEQRDQYIKTISTEQAVSFRQELINNNRKQKKNKR